MGKALIGITGRRWSAKTLGSHLPTAMSELSFDLHFSDYPRSVALAGGLPVELTRDAEVAGIIERIDGLVLSGGADLDPRSYNAQPDENLGPLEQDRDDWEFALLDAARERGLPVLAICRGFQLVNVAFGGTLHQHVELDEGVGHPQWDVSGRSVTHEVRVLDATIASTLFPEALGVNSLHHQTVDRVGDGLIVSAVAPDGVIEGLETPDGSILALQWHPELLTAPDRSFEWVVREASARMERETSLRG
ncbi:MAG: gamma-glutamyl-gamma-aminobutyrate hydrolase family protein [Acidimicrobiales bacterium]